MGDLLHSSLLTLTLTMLTYPRADYPSHYAGSKIKRIKSDPAASNVRISLSESVRRIQCQCFIHVCQFQ